MACIVSDKTQVAARGGLGAVMGAKNLKAIAVKGNQKPLISEPEEFKRYAEEWKTANLTNPEMQLYIKYGTAGILGNMHSLGDLPIMNFSRGVFPGYEKITGQHLVDNFLCKNLTCRGCWVAHRKLLEINEGGKVLRAELPEYEDLAAWGSNIGLADPARVVELAELADSLGIDALDGSNVVALAMECYEKGILTKEDTGGTDLRFGNAEAAAEIMQCIAYRKGLGNVLAEGPGRAAKIIGRGATEICAHIKNMSPIMHDFRAFWGFALQYTVATGGPTHEGGPRALEQTGVLPRFSTQGKAAAVKQGQEVRCFINSLGVCLFGAIGVPIEVLTGALSAALGYQFTADEVKKTVLRAVNLRRAFAVRRGLLPDDDTLSPRLLEAPMEGGAKGSKIDIVPMVREYYDLMGWDEKTGKPSRKTLADLGLEDIIDDIW
ncbi:MAG: hypothetical protein D9V47_05320 [Clostridia bacterium]|nr:MAG: hypothetical protein D9V47_05320 [Clostridia bacterium]